MGSDSPGLWVETAPNQRTRLPLEFGSRIIGRRPDAGLVLDDEHVSGHHAELYWDGDRLRIRDLGSRNGTAVNDQQISDWTDLTNGDVVRFGVVNGVVELPNAPRSGTPAPSPVTPPPPMPHREAPMTPLSQRPIFISHSSKDKRLVREIAGYLRRCHWTVWMDEAEIEGGEAWRRSLMQALEDSWIVLLVVSHASMTSKWVMREIDAADRLGRKVIPIALENVPYADDLRLTLSGVQRIEAANINDADQWRNMLSRLDNALINAARERQPGKPGGFRIALGMTMIVIGLIGALAGFAAFFYLGQKSVDDPGSDLPSPTIGWAVFAVSLVIAGVGAGIHRSGKRKGI